MEKKTKWPAELFGEFGLWVPKPLGKGMRRVWRGGREEQGLALALVSAPSGVEGKERLGVGEPLTLSFIGEECP